METQVFVLHGLCPGGGIGRRARLRIWCSQGRAGSTPVPGTTYLNDFDHLRFRSQKPTNDHEMKRTFHRPLNVPRLRRLTRRSRDLPKQPAPPRRATLSF